MADKNLKTDPNLWVELYADKLYGFVLKKVFSEELAKDLVQETFLAALQGMHGFKGESTELTWLTAILKNKIIDSYKKKKLPIEQLTDDVFFENYGHWRSQPLEIGINESNYLENKELGKVLEQCMKKLPALWLTVFSLKYVDDSSTELICSSLSLTAANYWVIVHRSKLSLRACLQKHWL